MQCLPNFLIWGKEESVTHSLRSSDVAVCTHTKKCTGPSFDYITLSINCFIWGRNVYSLEMNRRTPAAAFSVAFREELLLDCLFLLRKEKFSPLFSARDQWWRWEQRERALLLPNVVVDLCFPSLCPGVAPRAYCCPDPQTEREGGFSAEHWVCSSDSGKERSEWRDACADLHLNWNICPGTFAVVFEFSQAFPATSFHTCTSDGSLQACCNLAGISAVCQHNYQCESGRMHQIYPIQRSRRLFIPSFDLIWYDFVLLRWKSVNEEDFRDQRKAF